MIVIGYIVGKDNETQEDYFLAGRSMSWFPVSLSVAATMISCNAFIGGPGWGYTNGLFPFMQNISVPLSIMLASMIFVPFLYSLRLTSIYEYIELRLGRKTRLLSVIAFLMNSLIQVSSMVFIPALVLNRFTGIDINTIIIIVVIISIVYTLLGGIKAVIITDAIQMIVIWGGVIGGLIYTFGVRDLSFYETFNTAKELGKLNSLDFSFQASIFDANGFFAATFGGTVMWLRYFAFDQAQIQRLSTSKSIKDLKKSYVISGILMNLLYFIFVLLGALLFVLFGGQSFENANDVMIMFIQNLPVGLIGLLLAGLFAAAMSSVDSLLNSMSTVFIKDIYEPYIGRNKETNLKLSMTISLFFGILIIFITIIAFSGTTSSILSVIGQYISYISGPSCGLFLLALMTDKANDKGVCIGTTISFFIMIFWVRTLGITWMWNSIIGVVLTCVFGYIISLLAKDEPTAHQLTYTIKHYRKKLLEENKLSEDGISILPFKMGMHEIILLGFFLVQFLILILISN
ncbi:sodium:solute symporter [Candidatus Epulonipiscium fishelsonii]|uniref:Sodium:solute symporter n=1 Tax=Candidatus Epulonipiscium fishelsonii TaxID=77094 RepID=A0ACC8XAQ0_9FIRM|nr:sodium:solute symporter [Epulopiscium sp. SCG-B05WGA-EpuloA1]ONI39576.1 sodium:solute symporter [Epulopiscium sp. SCG-B11WGA-EpuloA1]